MHAIISFCNEGLKAIDTLIQVKKLTNNIVILNDGKLNEESKNIINKLGIKYIEYEKIGFKEKHLACYISSFNTDDYLLHIDSDEILSDSLIEEIKFILTNTEKNLIYFADLEHIGKYKLSYKKNCMRISKAIIYKKNSIKKIIGLPHKGLILSGTIAYLKNNIYHKADHINFNLINYLKREFYFSSKDAEYRTQNICIYANSKLQIVKPNSSDLLVIDSLRYSYPIVLFFPCLLYRLYQSLTWLFLTRNYFTIKYEFKILIGRMFYQLNLLLKIIYFKYIK